jgi:protein phosphatase
VNELLSIGEFSARCGLSPKVLRTYAAEGLLVPAAVDAWSGYRYYARHQLPRAILIRQLRRAGIPLRDISDFLHDPDQARLRAFEHDIDRDAADRKGALAAACAHLATLSTAPGSPKPHPGGTTMTTITAGSATDPGTVRDNSQDALLVSPPLFAVADGMGASPAGETASQLALYTLQAHLADPPTAAGLATAARAASQAIFETARTDPSLEHMATTLTALAVLSHGDQAQLAIASIGDSRAYLLRDGQLRQLTRDHTIVAALTDAGDLTPDEAATHPRRTLLTRALGLTPDTDPDIHLPAVPAPARLLLCTDGLTAHVGDPQITSILASTTDPGQAATRLIQLANHQGGTDNTTAIVIDIRPDQDS